MRWTENDLKMVLTRHANSPAASARASANPGQARHRALGRLPAGHMNKTETAYSEHLTALQHNGDVLWWKFEGIKLRLADNTFYTPDFAVLQWESHLEMHEIKGHWEDDARVKIKVAAALFPFHFIAVYRGKHGGWEREEF